MKKLLLKGTLLGLSLCAGFSATAQFTLDGQYRPRFEFRNGFKSPIIETNEPAAFVEHRARLTGGYKEEKLGFKLSVQDIRVWGETGQINKTDQNLSVHEAYGEYYASKVSFFRIGRQELGYDGDRFIGTLNWAAQGRSFDAVKYIYKNDSTGLTINAVLTFNQDGLAADGSPEPANLVGTAYTTPAGKNATTVFNLDLPKAQQLLHINKKFSSGDIGLMLLAETRESFDQDGNQIGTPFQQYHIGLTPNIKFGEYKLGIKGFYTGGTAAKYQSTDQIKETKLGGYFANLIFQATNAPAKPLIGVDYISGDDEKTDGIEGWAPLYGTNHKYYGLMDYFYVGNGHGGVNNASAGLVDIYLKTTFKAGEKNQILGHLHYFMADKSRTYGTRKFSGSLGTEIDLVFVRNISPGVQFKAGYSHMLGITETMQALKGQYDSTSDSFNEVKGVQNWAWLMIDFTPRFLNLSKK